jgi:hypothetical protein
MRRLAFVFVTAALVGASTLTAAPPASRPAAPSAGPPAAQPARRPGGPATDPSPVGADEQAAALAAFTFDRAVNAGNLAAAKAASSGSDRQVRVLGAIVSLSAAANRFAEAAALRYGANNEASASVRPRTPPTNASDVGIVGDRARVSPLQGPSLYPVRTVHLVRKDGAWRVDLDTMFKASDDAAADKMVARVAALARGADEVTADVLAETHKTAAEALRAYRAKGRAILLVASPGTQPAPASVPAKP